MVEWWFSILDEVLLWLEQAKLLVRVTHSPTQFQDCFELFSRGKLHQMIARQRREWSSKSTVYWVGLFQVLLDLFIVIFINEESISCKIINTIFILLNWGHWNLRLIYKHHWMLIRLFALYNVFLDNATFCQYLFGEIYLLWKSAQKDFIVFNTDDFIIVVVF